MAAAAVGLPVPGFGARLAAASTTLAAAPRAGHMGPVNYNLVFSNLGKLGIMPVNQQHLAEVDAGQRNITYLDFMADYTNRVVPLRGEELTAALLNARNNGVLQTVSPPMLTSEMNFAIQRMEVLQFEFDEIGPGGIARTTGYRETSRTAGLSMFKRAMRIEMNKLEDENFGARWFAQATQAIKDQALMTIVKQILLNTIQVPWLESARRLTSPTHGFNHARQQLTDGRTFGLAQRDPVALLHHVVGMCNSFNQFDTMIVPEGTQGLLSGFAGESRIMPAYQLVYDTALRRTLAFTYDGNSSFKTIPTGAGAALNIIEAFAMRADFDDPAETMVQPYKASVVLGEMATMPVRSMDEPYSGERGALDIGLVDQTANTLVVRRVSYYDALAACPLFLERDNPKPVAGGVSNLVKDLATVYNGEKANIVYRFFREAASEDNDAIATKYLNSDIALDQMAEWREICGFVLWNDTAAQVDFPTIVADLEIKSLPPRHVHRCAEAVVKKLGFASSAFKEPTDDDTLRDTVLKKLNTVLQDFPEYDKAYFDKATGTFANYSLVVDGMPLNFADPAYAVRADNTAAKTAAQAARANYVRTYGVSVSSVLKPLASEDGKVYLGRVTPAFLSDAAARGAFADSESHWDHMLALVPDAALGDYLRLVHASTAGDRVLSDEEESALGAFHAYLSAYAGRPHAAEIIKQAAARAEAGNLAALATPLKAATEARLNGDTSVPAATLAATIRDALAGDAMDIDEPVPLAGPFQGFAADGKKKAKVAKKDGTGKIVNVDVAMSKNLNSAKQFDEYATTISEPLVRFVYAAILRSRFSLATCQGLARLGCELVRLNYVRPFITLHCSSIALSRSGPDTFITAMGHAMVLTGVDADAGYLTMNASFTLGVIPVEPKYTGIVPYAIMHTFHGGRNLAFIKTYEDFVSSASDKKALLALPVPVTETRYDYPVSLTKQAPYRAPNTGSVSPNQKMSGTDLLEMFVGRDIMDEMSLYGEDNGSYYDYLRVATSLQRACTWYNMNTNGGVNDWKPHPGTGALGDLMFNLPASAPAYMGLGMLPTNYDSTIVVH